MPVSPFSHATEQDGWVFVTGQMPFSGLANDSPLPRRDEAQTRQVFANLKTVLEGIGLGLEHVLMARVYLLHFDRDFLAMNAVYATFFPRPPAGPRTCIGVSGLARGRWSRSTSSPAGPAEPGCSPSAAAAACRRPAAACRADRYGVLPQQHTRRRTMPALPPWDDKLPIYQQLADLLAARLLDGEPPEGEPMPSVRARRPPPAEPLTVNRALQALGEAGLLERGAASACT